MSTIVSELNSVEKCPSNIVEDGDTKEGVKNGLLNGLVHNKKQISNVDDENEPLDMCVQVNADLSDFKKSVATLEQNHIEQDQVNVTRNVISVSKSKKKSKKKTHKSGQLDSNENFKDHEKKTNVSPVKPDSSTQDTPVSESLITNVESVKSLVEPHSDAIIIDPFPSCSKISINDDSEIFCGTSKIENKIPNNVTSDLEKLTVKDEYLEDCTPETKAQIEGETQCAQCNKKIQFVQYESELQMPMIMKIIQKDLSEPYSIYTYRYFIHNWPKLCFLAMCDGQCVGAIVCKLDLHRKVVRRGYIAMLAVDQKFRKLRIGSTLVQMAIHEMTLGDADEVVLETEVTNKPALKLYEKLGFVRDKRLFRYYLNGVDALRLKLWLR